VTLVLCLLCAIILDQLFGEPGKWHPLVGFGRAATAVEQSLNSINQTPSNAKKNGVVAVVILIAPPVLVALILAKIPVIGILFQILCAYFAIGARSLALHARAVDHALDKKDYETARTEVSKIVSRDTEPMKESDMVTATIESVLENGCDAVFSAMFWFLVLGAPGVVLCRLANTLDAMWGYKNERYLYFGWAAARFDDLLNWIPARLTAFTYALLGNFKTAWQCLRAQGPKWYSPNAGPVMASGAGALQITLGGPAQYDGKIKERLVLGTGRFPERRDIERALKLIRNGMLLWLAIAFCLFH
jgi:adenosylcobinamide-phosphate synthase